MSILYDFSNNLKIEKMSFPWTDKSVTGLKAGTPVDESGAVSNDGNAIGLVAEDIPHPGYSMYSVVEGEGDSLSAPISVITAGYVDLAAAEKASGLTLTDACKSALTGITFVGEDGLAAGALPEPTTEGDVLAVGKVADPSVVILPEQTVEIEEGETYYLPTGGDPTLFVDGEKVCVTVNNESVVGVVVEDDALYLSFDHECAFVYDGYEEKWMFFDSNSYYGGDPITISVTGTKPAWVETTESPYSAWDAVFRITFTLDAPIGDIIYNKWSFEDLVAKMITNKMPCAFLVGFVDERNSNYYFMETKAKGYLYGDSAIIHFDCYGGDAYSSFSFDLNKYGIENIQGN